MTIVDNGNVAIVSKKRKSFSPIIRTEALVKISYKAGFLMRLFNSYKYEIDTLVGQIQKTIAQEDDFNVSDLHNVIVTVENCTRIITGDIMISILFKEENIEEESIKKLAEEIQNHVNWNFNNWRLACTIVEIGAGKKFFF